MLAPTLRPPKMSNERPIEPRPAAEQNGPLGGYDFLDLEGELARRRGQPDAPAPAAPPAAMIERPTETCEPPAPTADEVWLLDADDGQAPPPKLRGVMSAPLTLEASYCEPEPALRAVSRAARRAVLVMGVVIVAIAGVQLSRQRVQLDDAIEARPAAKPERSFHRETELVGPASTGRVEVHSNRDRLDGPMVAGPLRPTEPDELTVWESFSEEDESTDPFELDGPAASASFQVLEDELALAREETSIEGELQALIEAAEDGAPAPTPTPDVVALPVMGELLLAELRAHPPALGPMAVAAGPPMPLGS